MLNYCIIHIFFTFSHALRFNTAKLGGECITEDVGLKEMLYKLFIVYQCMVNAISCLVSPVAGKCTQISTSDLKASPYFMCNSFISYIFLVSKVWRLYRDKINIKPMGKTQWQNEWWLWRRDYWTCMMKTWKMHWKIIQFWVLSTSDFDSKYDTSEHVTI